MKSKLLISIISLMLSTGLFSQKILFDEDFNTTEWLDAFAEYLTGTLGVPTDLRTAPDNTAYDLGTAATIKGYVFNGPVRRQDPSFTSVCSRTFNYCFRMRNGGASFLEFPEVVNAGKMSIYVRNENATTANVLNLQSTDELDVWNNITQWNVPGFDSYPGTDFLLTYDINTSGTVKLRIQRQQARFLQIYRIVLEEYVDVSTSVGNSSFEKQVGLTVDNKTVHFTQIITDASLSVCDISGRQVFKTNVNDDKISLNQLNPGVYIVKLQALQGELTQKVIIK